MSHEQPCELPISQCPIQFVVDLLGNKWSILILRELFGGDRRTHELLKALPGLGTKTLMARLRELMAQGLVERQVYAEVPPRVDYRLTAKGAQLRPVLIALHELGSQWLAQDPCACTLTQIPTEFPLPELTPIPMLDASL